MPCEPIVNQAGEAVGYLCSPTVSDAAIGMRYCPICQRREAYFVEFYEWYGPSSICLCCGQRWNEGYLSRQGRGWARGIARVLASDALREALEGGGSNDRCTK